MTKAVMVDWNVAKAAEASGDLVRMRDAYEAMVLQNPDLPAARLKLAQVHLLDGRYRAAFNAAEAAEAAMKRSGRWQALPYVAQQWLAFDERSRVATLINEADWDRPDVLSQSAVLAQRLWLADDNENALRLIDHAATRLPAHHLLCHARGEVLNHLGRMEEARAEYERALTLAPEYPHPHRALAFHFPARVPGERIGRVGAALDAARMHGRDDDIVELEYAMFREMEHAGLHEDAWRHLEAGFTLRRQVQGHDHEGWARGIDALIRAHSDAGMEVAHGDDGPTGNIFVVGMPRSGTTVLDRMFGNHPGIVSRGELNAFSRSLSWEIDRFHEPPISAELVELSRRADMAAVGERYREKTRALHREGQCLLDKNPLNLQNAGYIARALPSARIICLLRDPMDACFSNLKELFAAGAYTYSYSLEDVADHYAGFIKLANFWAQAFPARFKVVSYENLVEQPNESLVSIMDFCGMDYRAGQEDITLNQSPVSTASRAQVRQPLNRRGIGAWQRYASQLEPMRRRLEMHGLA